MPPSQRIGGGVAQPAALADAAASVDDDATQSIKGQLVAYKSLTELGSDAEQDNAIEGAEELTDAIEAAPP